MGHHHHHQCDCCCEHEHHDDCCQSSCHQESCEHPGHGDEDFAHQLLEMADEAWMEVLKEKIKAHINAASGKHLDGLAKLVAQSNKERWDHKLAKHQVLDSYREKLAQFFRK
jgi:hypothetical protein